MRGELNITIVIPSGKLTNRWLEYPQFWRGNTSTQFRGHHFPASYVRLPECNPLIHPGNPWKINGWKPRNNRLSANPKKHHGFLFPTIAASLDHAGLLLPDPLISELPSIDDILPMLWAEKGPKLRSEVLNGKPKTTWWFQWFFYFYPIIWGRFPIWLIFFKGVETTHQAEKIFQKKTPGLPSSIFPPGFCFKKFHNSRAPKNTAPFREKSKHIPRNLPFEW